ncbi:MAG TPA: hypothetical protein DCY91_18100 [Cyanobacteria bacterium UBA11370]|nr:hypothetical protein [Cyanobacteria bacterium UBA11370]
MNKQLLSMTMTVPFLFIEAGQAFAGTQTVTELLQFPRQTPRTIQVTLNNQQPLPFMLGARDDDEQLEACRWVGSCDGTDDHKSGVRR